MAVTKAQAFSAAEWAGQFPEHPRARAEAVYHAAVAAVERYARAAPDAIRAEAVHRCGAYLLSIAPGRPRQQSVGSAQETLIVPAGTSPLRSSGAMALLSPYRSRRAL